jgi:homogentisate 1,2-dioxygenase
MIFESINRRSLSLYLTGFGNYHASEAIPGALPVLQNSPQNCPMGLYAEQLNGSAFTNPRHKNLRSWLYRSRPSASAHSYRLYDHQIVLPFAEFQAPNPMRWSPRVMPKTKKDFVDSLAHIAGNKRLNCYIYQCNQSMTHRYFSNSDGELLLVPYLGAISLYTEFGQLEIIPGMIAVIPRGIRFRVELTDDNAAGYICENAGTPLTLPTLGLIGANGLASPRHFLYPKARVEILEEKVCLLNKYQHKLWITEHNHSPLDVVAWHGNYAPYCYDLALFNTLNTVSFDHPDPSIFTVLTSESNAPGIANLDFVIFPERWMVAEHTFRPPYFHRNVMSELMGLVRGAYDAKEDGFGIGGISIHNCMTPHGPDTKAYKKGASQSLKPEQYRKTLAFMFESHKPWQVTEYAFQHPSFQQNYLQCWDGLTKNHQA